MIDRLTVQRILDTAQIVDVVSDFVSLKRAGANYKGLCPFHDDRTPSFIVSPAKNYCKCFACGKGGSPVGFIMEHEQLAYPEALRYLARKYHIEIQEREQTDEERALMSERESMFILNDYALQWFEKQLYDSVDGRTIGMAYFRHRGFRDDIIRKFRLGFSPSVSDALCRDTLAKGYNKDYLLKTGLAYESQNGARLTDRFHGRVIFPIFNISGKVCGFGGRVLDAATKGVNVKYQNSPESAVYSKKRELYGLYQAKSAIVKADCCYLVEGYTDVMAMHQMGVENVVASSGTALTTGQIALIHRLTSNIVVIYDGDAAGIKASQRGIDMLLEAGMNVRLLLLPDGDDPDSFARKHSAKEYQQYLNEHQVDFIGFKTNLLLQEAKDDPIRLSNLVNNIVDSISRIPDPITCRTYVRQAAQMLQMDEQMIASAVSRQIKALKEQRMKEKSNAREEADSAAANPYDQSSHTASAPPPNLPPDIPIDDEGHYLTEGTDANLTPGANQHLTPTATTDARIQLPTDGIANIERELARMIIRFGNKHVGVGEDEEGGEQVINVAEYIQGSLRQDNLELRDNTYREMLRIAVESKTDDRLPGETVFLNHPDQTIARLAFELSTDEEPLSRYHSKAQHIKTDDERLDEIVPLMMNNYKLCLVESELNKLMLSLRSREALNDKNVAIDVMRRYTELKKIQSALAKACGDRVVTGTKY